MKRAQFTLLILFLTVLGACTPKKETGVTTGSATKPTSTITSNGPIAADGSSPATVTITLLNSDGNPWGGVTPLFQATDTGNTNVYGPCTVTPSLGVYHCTMTSRKAETKTLVITHPLVKEGGNVAFHAGDADPSFSSIVGTTPAEADGLGVSFVTVTLKDAGENPLIGKVPLFMATNTGGTNTYGACSPTSSAGVSSCTLASRVAEFKTLQLVSPISLLGNDVLFEAGDADPANSTIFGTGPVIANGVATSTVSITLRDAGNNAVPGVVPSFTATNTGATNVYSSCSITNASGLSTCTLKSTKAESKVLSIAGPISKDGGTVVFQAGSPVAANSIITGSTPTVADGISTASIAVTLKDAFSNLVPAVMPTFSATGNGNAYSACSSSTSLGVSTCTMTSTKAESKVLSVTAPFVKTGAAIDFIAGAADATLSSILGSGPVTANGVATSNVSVILLDANSNPVIGVVPTFVGTDTNTTNIYGTCSATDSLGASSCSMTSTKAELKTLSLVNPVAKTGGTVSFMPGGPHASNSTISGTTPVVADGSAASTVTITLMDLFSNPTPGLTPVFSATDTTTTNVYSTCSVTDASGVSTCSLASTKAESKTLAISAPVTKSDGIVVFQAGLPVALNSGIIGTGPVLADGVATSEVTINLRDASNNPVPGTVPTFTGTNTGTTNIYGVCPATDAYGDSICTLASRKAEIKTLSIATPVVKAGGTVTFNSGSPVSANTTITGTGPVVANGVTSSTVTIRLKDQFSNAVAGVDPQFSATDTGTTNTYTVCTTSNASGDSTCTLTSTKAEVKTLSITNPFAKTGGTVQFVAGAAVAINSNIIGTGPVVANGTSSSAVTVSLMDAFSNPVTGTIPTFTATDTGAENIYGACSSTSATGQSNCTLASNKAESKTLSIATPVSKAGGTVEFTAGVPVAATSTITATGPVVADGVAAAGVIITLKDASGNPVPGETPTFAATDTGTTNTYGSCSVTDGSGVSLCTLNSTKAETKTLAIATPVVKSDGTIDFTAGAASIAESSITGTTPVVADGLASSSVTITLKDSFQNPLIGTTPTFTATDSSSGNTYGACSATSAFGVSTCTLKSTVAESKVVSLATPIIKTGNAVAFTPGAPSVANSSIIGSGPVVADGAASSTVTVTLKDANNNAVAGVVPTFSATDVGTTNAYGACSSTDAQGESTCTLKSTKAETKILSLVTPIAKADGTVVFTPGAATAANSSIAGTGPVTANGVATSLVTITLKDAHDNAVPGEVPTFSATDTGTTNSYSACSASSALGVSTCTVTSTKAETKTLAIATPVVKSGGTVVFQPGNADSTNSSITGTGPVLANSVAESTITVVLQDAQSNPISGVVPTFSATDTGSNNVYGVCSSTDATGSSTCTLKSRTGETKTLSLVSPIAMAGGTVVFDTATASVGNSSITGTGPIVADGSATSSVTITLKDSMNVAIPGLTPTFSATDTGTQNTYGSCSVTDASGESVCTLASTKAESKILSIATPIVKAGGTVVFSAGSIAASTSSITGTGPVVADGTASSTITVTLLDAYSNPVAGSTPTFSATDTGSTNAYTACSVADTSGVSTCVLQSTKAETKTLSLLTPVSKTGGTVSFIAGSAVAANSTITGTGPTIADGSASSTVSIMLKDAYQNPVVGTVPTFSATNTGTTNAYGSCGSTNSSGVSTCTLKSTAAETKTLEIVTPVSKSDGTVVFTAGGALAANSSITGTGPIVANDSSTSTVTITLKDANNNPVIGTVPTFGATDTGTTNTYGICSSTNSSGVSSCTLKSQKAETKTLAIATPITKSDGTVSFTAGAASSTTTTIVGTTPVVANGVATSFITITILDQFSNPIAGTTPIYNATNTDTTNTYGSCSASSASGVSSCTLASTKAESKTLQLTSPTAVTGGLVVFQAGPVSATNSTIAGTGPVTADGTTTSAVTVTLKDASNNPVPGQTPTFSATNTGSGNTYGSCSLGDTNGVSSCTLKSTKAETKTLSIATPVSKAGGTVTFIAGLPVASTSTITGTGPVLADGSADSTVTITLRDANANPVSGETPEFSGSGTSNFYDDCSVGDASGVSTCLMQSTVAETKTLSITVPVTKVGGTVTFTAGGASAANSTIVATTPVVADGTASSTITITLQDASGNAVSGTVPTFTASGTSNTLGTCSSTSASGISTCTLKSTKAESKSVAIATPIVKAGNAAVFTAGAAVASNSTITGTGPIDADGVSTSAITVTLKDTNSNNVVGTTPTFTATGTGNTLGSCTATNASGVSTCTLASSAAGTKILAIATPVAKTDGTVIFQSGGAVAANSTITGTTGITANGTSTSTVTITLKDINSNNVTGVVPTFTATNTGTTNINGTCSSTNASGVSTCTLASTKAEIKTLAIATPVVKAGGTVTFVAGSASTTTSTIDGTSPTLANGTDTAGITITLLDAFNNPVSGTVPTFTATGTSNTLGTCASSDSNGVSSCTLRSTKAEAKSLAMVTPVAVTGPDIDFNPNGIDLQVPIEMLDRGLIATTSAVIYNRSRTSLNTDDYVANNNTYYFEIVAHNANTTTAYALSLVDGANNILSDTSISVPANTSAANMRRFRVEFTPNEGADTYRIRMPATAAASQLYVHSAKIIVEQDNATATKIYIPLTNFDEASDSNSDASGTVATTTATSFTAGATYTPWWQRNDSVYDTIPTGSSWTFEAVSSTNTTTGVASVALYNRTTSQQVAVTSCTGTTICLGSSSFASNATNFADGNQYDVRWKSSISSATARIFKAGLWVKLKYLKKAEVLQRLTKRRSSTTATTNFFDGRLLWEASRWSNPTVYFQTVGYPATSAIALFSVSNTDTGSVSMTAVSGGSITPDATQSIKRTAALSLVDNDRYFVRHTRTSGTIVMVGSFLVIRATE